MSASLHAAAARRSFVATPATAQANRAWFVVDAAGKPLGRIASEIAHVLRGKHKPTYTPHVDTGDFVVVVNADKVLLTGNKLEGKLYQRHSGIPGGFKAETYRTLLGRKPELPIERAVKGMLPHTVLGRQMAAKLKVYATPDHPHTAQKPVPFPAFSLLRGAPAPLKDAASTPTKAAGIPTKKAG